MILAGVVHLFGPTRPSAIPWGIGAVVVDAMERVAWWAWTHVFIKPAVIVTPRIAHSDAFTAVMLKSGVLRIVAASAGINPCQPFFWPSASAGRAMGQSWIVGCESFARTLSAKASTTGGGTDSQRVTIDDCFPAANTHTAPEGFRRDISVLSWRTGKNSQSPEPLAGEVYQRLASAFGHFPKNTTLLSDLWQSGGSLNRCSRTLR